jgi:glycosyltransferase involved in cell wall biosynthesis
MIPSNIFTIIIPCKNEESYIYNTLQSISEQYGVYRINVLIADAKSTDNTISEIQRANIDFNNLIINVIDGGSVSYGRNKSVKYADTPYLIFMDADSILLDDKLIYNSYKNIHKYDLISAKQKSVDTIFFDNLIWLVFNFFRNVMSESFSTGCFFVISKNKFIELGGFDESVTQSEDFLLSRKIPKYKFKILNQYVGQDNRRFKKMGYFNFFKLVILNYINKNNIEWFKKDVGYWK